MSRIGGALLAFLPLLAAPGVTHLRAQSQSGEARVMAEGEREALKDWARRRYTALTSGSAEDLDGLPHGPETERLWALYFMSVEDGDWEEQALALQDSLAADDLPEHRQVTALGGALTVVRAKHSRWPPNKLKFLKAGLQVLDSLAGQAPDDPVVRYLRLVSTYYLPFFVDRDESVRDDLAVLARILPDRSDAFSGPVYRVVVRFVLDHGELSEEASRRLEGALAALEPRGEGTEP